MQARTSIRPRPAIWGLILVIAGFAILTSRAQTPVSPDPSPGAKSDPAIILDPKKYQELLDQLDRLKKLVEGTKPQAPSRCVIRAKVEPRGQKAVASLTMVYSMRTTQPRMAVALGGQRAFAVQAKLSDGSLPQLIPGENGLVAIIPEAGDHELTVTLETGITSVGSAGEPGFDIGLPRAAITTLALDAPEGIQRVSVGVRTAADRAGEMRRTSEDAAALRRNADQPGYPLGPVERLEVSWEPPAAAPAVPQVATRSAETEVTVRVDDTQIETTAVMRLRGPAREWQLVLPTGADVQADRPFGAALDPAFPTTTPTLPTILRPTDAANPVWTVRPPELGLMDWSLRITVRQSRPPPTEPTHRGPYAVGPFLVPTAARQSVTVRAFAPTTLKVGFDPAPDVRRQDLTSEDELVGIFKWATVGPLPPGSPRPLLQLDARPAPGFVRAQPNYTLRWTPGGWRLTTELRVTPVRSELEEMLIEVPSHWQALEAGPPELVDEVRVIRENGPVRQVLVHLIDPQKSNFTLTLSALHPFPASERSISLELPQIPTVAVTGARLTAIVPDGLEVRGTGIGDRAGGPQELTPTTAPGSTKTTAAITAVAGTYEKGVLRADLSWQPYRPELVAEVRAEIGLQDRQAVVNQTIKFRSADVESRAVRLRGPVGAVDLRAVPPVEQISPGEWTLRPPNDAAKEFTLSVRYVLPVPTRKGEASGPQRFPVGLLWPEAASRVEANVRVWGAGSLRQVVAVDGPWRELPPEPAPDRDALPWLTLAGSGSNLPLALDLADPDESVTTSTIVDRCLLQAWHGEGSAVALRGRFAIRRWASTNLAVEVPTSVNTELWLDGRRAEPVPLSESNGSRIVRIALPAAPAAGRSHVMLDVRYNLPPDRRALGKLTIPPPRVLGAEYRAATRWQIVTVPPNHTVLLATGLDFWPEFQWNWRGVGFGPVANAETPELERWLDAGPDGDPSDPAFVGIDAVTARQAVLSNVQLFRVPRSVWIAGWSTLALVLAAAIARLRQRLLAPAIAVLGVVFFVTASIWPQPTALVIWGFQPGLVIALLVAGTIGLLRVYRRWRMMHLPGFTPVITEAPPPMVVPGSTGMAGRSSTPGSAVVPLDGSGATGPYAPVSPSGS